ncbi:MAG: copper chaperone PCu(A)C [Pseudoxanthomonas sp.]
MATTRLLQRIFAALACAVALPAFAGECRLALKDGWISLPPVPEPTVLAGYGRIENPCARAAVVVSVQSPVFGHAMVHESSVVDGVSRMRMLDELPIAAKGDAVFAPGGLHLMLMHPSAPVKEGDRIAVTFKLKDGDEVSGELVVKKAAP